MRIAQGPGFSTTPGAGSHDPLAKRSKKELLPFVGQRSTTTRALCGRPSPNPPSSINGYSSSDAQWFMRLPDKAQKIHFSKEEQLLLQGHCQTIIPDAADVVFYKFGHQRNQSVPSLGTFSDSSLSSVNSLEKDFLIDTDSDMEDPMLDSFRWMEDEDELDLSLDDYHTSISSITQSSDKPSSRRPSFRRSLSLTSIPFSTAKFSSNKVSQKQKPTEPPPILPLLSHQRNSSSLHQGASHPKCSIHTPELAVESSTTYYQDPEARLKLRVYLASPQKFDEAIEFGFPSLDDKQTTSLSRPSLSKHHHTDSVIQTFFNDDNLSFFNVIEEDDPHSRKANHPEGPPNSAFHYPYRLPPSKPTSLNSETSRSTFERYGNVLSGTREMTLRMTLTRPDLRKAERPLYTNDGDPLALQNLPPMKDSNDIWESQPKDSIMKKWWHKMSRKTVMA